ncbi:unnamed protein product [Phytomonas sp. Hart1]|nr:unnamed protein product [Phytomonas sp. Hart1]|eukprot:CCW70269.1 unnamed protein product [Phytomonas sp. isolate Hart1]
MYSSLGITREQLFGDVYSSWMRDIFEKPSEETRQLFNDMVEAGFSTERQIVLSRQRLGVNTIHSLAALLHRTPLTKLVLSGNALRDAGCEVIARLVGELPQLTHLDLGTSGIGAAGAAAIGVAVANHRKLAALILDSQSGDPYANQITQAGATALLEGCVRCHTLRTLNLSGNCFADKTDAARPTGIGGAASSSSTVLSTSERKGGRGAADTSSIDEKMTWKGRSVSSWQAGNETASSVAGEHASVRSPVELLEELLRHSSLDKLRLRNVGLSGPGALRLISALHDNFALTVLDISNNNLPPEVGDAIGSLLMERTSVRNQLSLKALYLNGNYFFSLPSAGSMERQVMSACTTRPSIIEEEYRSTAIRSVSFAAILGSSRKTSTMLLLSALSHDRILTTLELDRCGIELNAIRTLCRALLNNTTLQCLSLRDNKICTTAAVDLGRVLCHHHALRRLCLAGNRIKDEGACAMATLLRVVSLNSAEEAPGAPSSTSASSLEVLDLQRTWLSDRGLIALGVALRLNETLRVLHLHDNFFTDQSGEAFAALVEENHSLVRCQLGSTSVPYPVVARVQRVMERNRRALERREQDELNREVIALHYQNYKLEEARIELESMQYKSSELKRALDQVELQCKQDQSEFAKKCNELEEHIKNYTDQAARMKDERETLEADAKKASEEFEVDMSEAKGKLEAEIKQREQVEEEHRRVAQELEFWKGNPQEREVAKHAQLEQAKKEAREWELQRKTYREQIDALSVKVRALEERAATIKPSGKKVPVGRGRKGSTSSRSKSKLKKTKRASSKK